MTFSDQSTLYLLEDQTSLLLKEKAMPDIVSILNKFFDHHKISKPRIFTLSYQNRFLYISFLHKLTFSITHIQIKTYVNAKNVQRAWETNLSLEKEPILH